MTKYDKTWLQFAFPFYLLCIVGVLVITSRYFSCVERLTRKRVIPVIATIFLLSYSKILLVTAKALFSYTTVHEIDGNNIKHKKIWLWDSNIQLFGQQFIPLFVASLIISLLANLAVKIQWIFIENPSLHMKITWKNKSLYFQWDFTTWCNAMKTIWIFQNIQHPMKMSWKPPEKYYSIEHPMKMLSKPFEKHFPVHHPNGDPLKMLWILLTV